MRRARTRRPALRTMPRRRRSRPPTPPTMPLARPRSRCQPDRLLCRARTFATWCLHWDHWAAWLALCTRSGSYQGQSVTGRALASCHSLVAVARASSVLWLSSAIFTTASLANPCFGLCVLESQLPHAVPADVQARHAICLDVAPPHSVLRSCTAHAHRRRVCPTRSRSCSSA